MSETKPREWNIQLKHNRVLGGTGVYMDAENVTVVEKSALDAALARCADLEKKLIASRETARKQSQLHIEKNQRINELHQQISEACEAANAFSLEKIKELEAKCADYERALEKAVELLMEPHRTGEAHEARSSCEEALEKWKKE